LEERGVGTNKGGRVYPRVLGQLTRVCTGKVWCFALVERSALT